MIQMEVEGTESGIEVFIKDVKTGLNPYIHVDEIEVERLDSEKGYSGFRME